MTREQTAPSGNSKAIRPLEALNFFMADMQAGIGPFLGVFLLAHGWRSGLIGSVMTIGGIAGMAMTAPARRACRCDFTQAALRRRARRLHRAGVDDHPPVPELLARSPLSQVATAIAGAAIGPAVAGMTLGIVRQAGFNRQNGRNQAFNHAGNMVGAGLSGLLGWRFGFAGRLLAGGASSASCRSSPC